MKARGHNILDIQPFRVHTCRRWIQVSYRDEDCSIIVLPEALGIAAFQLVFPKECSLYDVAWQLSPDPRRRVFSRIIAILTVPKPLKAKISVQIHALTQLKIGAWSAYSPWSTWFRPSCGIYYAEPLLPIRKIRLTKWNHHFREIWARSTTEHPCFSEK